LLDDTIYFAKRLSKLTDKVQLEVYDGMGHGYLNLLDHVPEAFEACENVIKWINKNV
jgi:acetyl esterase/lipase